MNEPQHLTAHGWIFRWQPAQKTPERLLLLVHGLTGDENVMWMLVRNLSASYSILAPRAPYSAQEGGYTWRRANLNPEGFPSDDDLQPAAEALINFLDEWMESVGMEPQPFDVMGFSQGAAMAYLLSLHYPARVRKLAALSGFLPEGLVEPAGNVLKGKQIFVSHGHQDEMVPVERARGAVAQLKAWGAEVTYCESDAAHKVNKDCLRAMEKFFEEN